MNKSKRRYNLSIVTAIILLPLLLITSYFIYYFWPYYVDDNSIEQVVTSDGNLISFEKFDVSITIPNDCALVSSPKSFIKRGYWKGDILCSGSQVGQISTSPIRFMGPEDQDRFPEDMARYPLVLGLSRSHLDESVLGHRQIIVSDKANSRYLIIDSVQELYDQIIQTLNEG
jgi:hypothetical protein